MGSVRLGEIEGPKAPSEVRVGGPRTREKMKRAACRIWTCLCTAHSVRTLAIMYDRGRVIKFC